MRKMFASSVNPEKISLTLKSLVPLVIFGLGYFGVYTITENDLYGLLEAIIAAISAISFAYGLARKIIAKMRPTN